jgi:hypothetical protein
LNSALSQVNSMDYSMASILFTQECLGFSAIAMALVQREIFSPEVPVALHTCDPVEGPVNLVAKKYAARLDISRNIYFHIGKGQDL